MSLRSSGFYCDVCNSPMVMEMFLNKPIKGFSLSCSPDKLHAHDKCMELIEPACKAEDPNMLPPGPLRELLENVKAHNAKLDSTGESGGTKPKEEIKNV
jgi:hypothetical protein